MDFDQSQEEEQLMKELEAAVEEFQDDMSSILSELIGKEVFTLEQVSNAFDRTLTDEQ